MPTTTKRCIVGSCKREAAHPSSYCAQHGDLKAVKVRILKRDFAVLGGCDELVRELWGKGQLQWIDLEYSGDSITEVLRALRSKAAALGSDVKVLDILEPLGGEMIFTFEHNR